MNYLGHAYLSFDSPQILVGNMISDMVKGRSRFGYTANIQCGITLHRDIDQYTDSHPSIKEAKEYFRDEYRLYSAPIVDIIFDHYLAADNNIFPGNSLQLFASSVYNILEDHSVHLPYRFSVMLPYMKQQNWLYNYRTINGISNSLAGLVRRSAYMTNHQPAIEILSNNYQQIQIHYNSFIADVKSFAKNRFEELTAGI